MTSNTSLIGAAMLLVVLLALYGYISVSRFESAQVPAAAQQSAQIANPASTNCVQVGGSLEIRGGVDGETGFCHLPDGRVCEEWALFRDGSCVQPE